MRNLISHNAFRFLSVGTTTLFENPGSGSESREQKFHGVCNETPSSGAGGFHLNQGCLRENLVQGKSCF
ncbi:MULTISPECIES: hypothetical protein [Leptospira]|uniref:Uncharacterized protein n=1 Tax=Leptospira kirschneri serovar Pomona TaxID=561005 RepID=A0A1T1DUI5_9LEPT|nr:MULTISPECIES: hypothetical protein [Leptospira]EMK09056.1 hypothetical protein LEP1GSC166_0983 [Leptospira kirschneri]KXZ30419.1 hypothetical protein AYB32_08145 [Leptospira kirschneri]KXZ34087.1 hypothetical protein AYB34_08955 [Leptospira sp. ZV016]OOV44512.1 hypothetical protein B1J93_05805 [Leptospira kirschneri serovar Pomona]